MRRLTIASTGIIIAAFIAACTSNSAGLHYERPNISTSSTSAGSLPLSSTHSRENNYTEPTTSVVTGTTNIALTSSAVNSNNLGRFDVPLSALTFELAEMNDMHYMVYLPTVRPKTDTGKRLEDSSGLGLGYNLGPVNYQDRVLFSHFTLSPNGQYYCFRPDSAICSGEYSDEYIIHFYKPLANDIDQATKDNVPTSCGRGFTIRFDGLSAINCPATQSNGRVHTIVFAWMHNVYAISAKGNFSDQFIDSFHLTK